MIQATCSHCDYRRAFAVELGGKYYRCPECKEGVIAVPRPSAEEAERGTELRISDEREAAEAAAEVEAKEESHQGEVGEARRLLVECGLCGFHVGVPPEFFGKTVFCPQCRGTTVFTESTLEPVKDELLDRLIMETDERRALFPAPGTRRPWSPVRSFGVGVGLGLVVLVVGWMAHNTYRRLRQQSEVEEALEAGWRYGVEEGTKSIHEPWCEDAGALDARISAEELSDLLRAGYRQHNCR